MGPRQAQAVYIETTLETPFFFATELVYDHKISETKFDICYIKKFQDFFRFSEKLVDFH